MTRNGLPSSSRTSRYGVRGRGGRHGSLLRTVAAQGVLTLDRYHGGGFGTGGPGRLPGAAARAELGVLSDLPALLPDTGPATDVTATFLAFALAARSIPTSAMRAALASLSCDCRSQATEQHRRPLLTNCRPQPRQGRETPSRGLETTSPGVKPRSHWRARRWHLQVLRRLSSSSRWPNTK